MGIEKFIEIDCLLSYYGALLTEHQNKIMNDYYREDYSLAEISENYGISRQAVHDTIKRTEAILYDYEKKLELKLKDEENSKIFKAALQDINELQEKHMIIGGNKNIQKLKSFLMEWI